MLAGKATADAKNSQELAADSAAALAYEILANYTRAVKPISEFRGSGPSVKAIPSSAAAGLPQAAPVAGLGKTETTREAGDGLAGMSKDSSGPIKIFISYSHQDEPMREKLGNHLALLKHEGVIDDWHDRRIMPWTKLG